jgi:hypothetical protein
MATAELALTVPTLMLLLAVGVWLQSAIALQARCLDAARAGARAAARGDPDSTVRAQMAAALPTDASIAIAHRGVQVTVTVRAMTPVPGGLSALVAAPTVGGSATGVQEPG